MLHLYSPQSLQKLCILLRNSRRPILERHTRLLLNQLPCMLDVLLPRAFRAHRKTHTERPVQQRLRKQDLMSGAKARVQRAVEVIQRFLRQLGAAWDEAEHGKRERWWRDDGEVRGCLNQRGEVSV